MKYNRVLLKLSGEAMGGADGQGLPTKNDRDAASPLGESMRHPCRIIPIMPVIAPQAV